MGMVIAVYFGYFTGLLSCHCVVAACSDKSLRFINAQTAELLDIHRDLHGSAAIRTISAIRDRFVITGGMDGTVRVLDINSGKIVASVAAHKRMINAMAIYDTPTHSRALVVTGGYDSILSIVCLDSDTGAFKSQSSIQLKTIPTALSFCDSDGALTLLVCRQDSTIMSYYQIDLNNVTTLAESSSINLCDVQYSNYLFTPMSISVHGKRFAVATSQEPVMRVVIGTVGSPYIEDNLNGNAAQDKYSIPKVIWRPDGNVGIVLACINLTNTRAYGSMVMMELSGE